MKEKKCPICEKGKLVRVEDIVSEVEGYFFIEKGNRCTSCGEEFIPEEEGQKMIKIARRMKIWEKPLKLYRKLSKSGRGTVLRIPADLEKNLDIKGDEVVVISKVGKNKIMIEIQSAS